MAEDERIQNQKKLAMEARNYQQQQMFLKKEELRGKKKAIETSAEEQKNI